MDFNPQRAVAYQELTTYEDSNLTKSVGKIPAKTQLDIAEIVGKSFKLKTGKYISTDKKL